MSCGLGPTSLSALKISKNSLLGIFSAQVCNFPTVLRVAFLQPLRKLYYYSTCVLLDFNFLAVATNLLAFQDAPDGGHTKPQE